MLFTERIKELRILNQMPQRQLAAALEIDTATYCKIEKGERKVRKEQIEVIAQVLNADKNDLITLWLAEEVCRIVRNENNAAQILKVAQKTL